MRFFYSEDSRLHGLILSCNLHYYYPVCFVPSAPLCLWADVCSSSSGCAPCPSSPPSRRCTEMFSPPYFQFIGFSLKLEAVCCAVSLFCHLHIRYCFHFNITFSLPRLRSGSFSPLSVLVSLPVILVLWDFTSFVC